MRVATRIKAPTTPSGIPKTAIIINDCSEFGTNLERIIHYRDGSPNFIGCLFNGELAVTSKAFNEYIREARKSGKLEVLV